MAWKVSRYDDTPRPAIAGGGGGTVTAKGQATRRSDGFENSEVGSIGWLNGTPVAKDTPQGSTAVPYGPSAGKIWNRRGK